MPTNNANEQLIAGLPSVGELRQRIAANLKERQLLRTLLRLAQKRADVEEAKRNC